MGTPPLWKVPLWAWYALASIGFGLMLLSRLGESLGWWGERP